MFRCRESIVEEAETILYDCYFNDSTFAFMNYMISCPKFNFLVFLMAFSYWVYSDEFSIAL